MKKLLSILSIGAVLASTSPALVACNNSKPGPKQNKLDLSQLKVYNLTVNANGFNNAQIYAEAKVQILQQFNAYGSTLATPYTLKSSDITVGNTAPEKGIAFQILNTDGTTPITATGTTALKAYTKGSVLTDNALTINLYSKDPNVKQPTTLKDGTTTPTATAKGYLDKFVYTNANLNKGNDIDPAATSGKKQLVQANVNNVSAISTIVPLVKNTAVAGVKTAIVHQKSDISKIIIDNLTKQLSKETTKLDGLKILAALKDTTALDITTSSITLYQNAGDTPADAATEITTTNLPRVAASTKTHIYAKFALPTLPNYIGFANSYVYLYLGDITDN